MTDKKTEALKLALKNAQPSFMTLGWMLVRNEDIAAIRDALAEQCVCGEPDTPGTHRTDGPCLAEQPAQLDPSVGTQVSKVWWDGDKLMAQPIPLQKLYKEPEQPAQQELDELTAQRDKLADILTRTANALKGQPAELSSHSWHDLPEVAQQLKTAQQQEPVAEVKLKERGGNAGIATVIHEIFDPMREPLRVGDKLYASPPASKPWVGLTDEERQTIFQERCPYIGPMFSAIEAKLKEKNT